PPFYPFHDPSDVRFLFSQRGGCQSIGSINLHPSRSSSPSPSPLHFSGQFEWHLFLYHSKQMIDNWSLSLSLRSHSLSSDCCLEQCRSWRQRNDNNADETL